MHLSHHGSITGMLSFTVSRRIKSSSAHESCHITPILKELHWLPVSQRIVFKLMLIVHKSFNNIAPIYISELLIRSTLHHAICAPATCHSFSKGTNFKTDHGGDTSLFSVAAPRLWNHLPTKLEFSITRFKS